jgi:hypothetical protein
MPDTFDNDDDPFFDGDESVDHGTEPELTEDGDVPGTGETEQPPAALSDEALASLAEGEAAEKAKAEAAAKAKAEAEQADAQVESFKTLVTGLLTHDDRDVSTGELPVVLVTQVTQAYGDLPGAKYKTFARNWLTDTMQDLMVKLAFIEARTIMILNTAVKDIKGTKPEALAKPKVDPTEAFAERAAGVMLAASLLTVPEGVEVTWAEKATALAQSLEQEVLTYKAYLDEAAKPLAEGETAPEAPKVHAAVLAAAKLAQGRVAAVRKTGTSTPRTPRAATSTPAGDGIRRNVGNHIREAIQSVEVGTFMAIAEIAKFESTEYAGVEISPGAISARLFPGGDASACKLDFVRPEGKDEGHAAKGAVRLS